MAFPKREIVHRNSARRPGVNAASVRNRAGQSGKETGGRDADEVLAGMSAKDKLNLSLAFGEASVKWREHQRAPEFWISAGDWKSGLARCLGAG